MIIHNCHLHIFTDKNVPVHFLPFGLIRLLSKRSITRPLGRLMHKIIPGTSNDAFDRYASFMNIGSRKSQSDIFNLVRSFYPAGTKYVILSMDMEYMGAGKVPQSFREQLNELAVLKETYPDEIYPFIFADPRRPDILPLVKEYIEEHQFHGIKLYPPLGYFPFDPKLYPIYEYAQSGNIPILSHCSRGGVYFRGDTNHLLVHPKTGQSLRQKKNSEFTDYFTDPANYEYVLKDFPELKICLAHFGGEEECNRYLQTPWDSSSTRSWFSVICELIRKNKNVYTDIAYTAQDTRFHSLFKVSLADPLIRPKVLFGTDFYMVEQDVSEREFSIRLRANLGEVDFQQIAETNPKQFLF